MKLFPALAFVCVLSLPMAAHAGFPVEVKEKCAVGGERFTYTTTGSYTTFGARPDGKPYGSWHFPLALPVCPGNGLVMYKDFSKAELKQLPALLASPEFQALRARETPYYRASWLARALDPADQDANWLLLSASWEADQNPAQHARYQAEFVRAMQQAPQPNDLTGYVMRFRVANALRELGRFDEAGGIVRDLPQAAVAPKAGGDESDEANKQGWRDLAAALTRAIARGDTSSEPLDLLPLDIAAGQCLGYPGEIEPRADALCKAEPLLSAITKMKTERAEYESDE